MNLQNALNIKGWMSENELLLLATWAKEFEILIEIGSYHGRSARAMADNTDGVIHCVDLWDCIIFSADNKFILLTTDLDYQIFQFNLKDKIKEGKIITHRKIFSEVNPFNADVIFIDGDHRYTGCINDIEHAMKFNPKIIAGHDYTKEWPGVMRAVDETFVGINVVDSIWYVVL